MSSMKICLKSKKVINPGEMLGTKYILIENGLIKNISNTQLKADKYIDLGDNYLSPGFIDLHTHGGGGAAGTQGTPEALSIISKTHARYGVTALVLALSAAPFSVIEKISEAINQQSNGGFGGSKIIGLYLEGPFMHMKKRGATPKSYLRKPDLHKNNAIFHCAGGRLKIISIAPELPGAMEAIDYFTNNNVICAIGHTNAGYEDAKLAIARGVKLATHLFNAMSSMHHRNPGVPGAVLENPDIPVELICDGIHLNPAIVKIVYKVKGVDKIILITDAITVMGTNLKKFVYLRQPVNVIKGKPTMLSGTIAGSSLTLNRALRNFITWTGSPIEEAIKTVTQNPAQILSLKSNNIAIGSPADLTAFDPEIDIKLTVTGGKIVYKK